MTILEKEQREKKRKSPSWQFHPIPRRRRRLQSRPCGVGKFGLAVRSTNSQVPNSLSHFLNRSSAMVLNSPLVLWVANISADLCQYVACNPERFSSDHVLYLIFCFPFRHFRLISLSLLSSLCPPSLLSSSSSSSGSDSESESDDLDSYGYNSHSDWFPLFYSI